MKYKAIIGLEIHCEITETNTKVFSGAKNSYENESNINVSAVDMAFPGVLPVLNKEAVKKALLASLMFNCKQPEYMYFERKNYYYPDLPKGYQITQDTKPAPVGVEGYVDYECNGVTKRAKINNIHLEEDTASLEHFENYSLIDYNRAGVGLLELVTYSCFHDADEVVSFLETIKSMYQYANISECDNKKGHIRCDVNISIMDSFLDEEKPENWGTKVEIKNVNSFSTVRDVINYEIKRQTELKENGTYENMEQQTRRWSEEEGKTIYMRSKIDSIDYKYFIEPNIPKYKIDKELIEEIKQLIPEFANKRKERYINSFGISEKDANVLVKDKNISDYFEECVSLGANPKDASNYIVTRLMGYLNKENKNINEIFMKPNMLSTICKFVSEGKISSQQAKEVFTICLEEEKTPEVIIKEKGFEQVSDETEIISLVNKILDENINAVEDFRNGKTNILGFLVGQVLKQSGGKFNPGLTAKILNEEIRKR